MDRDGKILVTGGHGFLGRCVVARLRAEGYGRVVAPRRNECDLTVQGEVEKLLFQERPEAVIHLAAEVGGIGEHVAHPGRFFYANMAMGLNLVEGARKVGVGKFVHIGSMASYPRGAAVPFREEQLWDGYPEGATAPYGLAKKVVGEMLRGYRAEYGVRGITLMPVNLYGPADNFESGSGQVVAALVGRFVEARRKGLEKVEVWGSGRSSREFLFVEDCAEGIVKAFESYDSSEPINLGTGCEVTIRCLAEQIGKAAGFTGEIAWDVSKPDGNARRCADVSRAAEAFGFRARTSLEDGLRRTVAWYESHVPEAKA